MPFMTQPTIDSMSPFFIVSHVETAVAFYRDKLGFEVQFQQPDKTPFFAIVGRGGAMLFLKSGEAEPLPNPRRDAEMRWDAYCHNPRPRRPRRRIRPTRRALQHAAERHQRRPARLRNH